MIIQSVINIISSHIYVQSVIIIIIIIIPFTCLIVLGGGGGGGLGECLVPEK